MLRIDDLAISLGVLGFSRIFSCIIFIDMSIRSRITRYYVLAIGWFFYGLGPCIELYFYLSLGAGNHPLFGFMVAIGTFLLIIGLYLHYFNVPLKSVIVVFSTLLFLFSISYIFIPGSASILTLFSQLVMVLVTVLIVLGKRIWIIRTGGMMSYSWISAFLLLSLFSIFIHLLSPDLRLSLKFFMTFVSNFVLLIAFLHFDRERNYRRIVESEALLSNSLHEREMLLKEIHHRVKNNLSIMNSLLSLQASYTNNTIVRDEIINARNRIEAMSLVHEKLHESTDFSNVSFREYVESVCFYISETLENGIELNVEIADINLEPDIIIPCGLIINEVITNSFRHALVSDLPVSVWLSATVLEDHCMKLNIRDNGRGLPEESLYEENQGLGFQLITNLVGQLNANMEIKNENGASFYFKIPLPSSSQNKKEGVKITA